MLEYKPTYNIYRTGWSPEKKKKKTAVNQGMMNQSSWCRVDDKWWNLKIGTTSEMESYLFDKMTNIFKTACIPFKEKVNIMLTYILS